MQRGIGLLQFAQKHLIQSNQAITAIKIAEGKLKL
jgi:hypothetical protein